MAHKSVIEFLEASAHDHSLRQELAKIIGAGDGDSSDESCARILGLGKSGDALSGVKRTAQMIYRGVRC